MEPGNQFTCSNAFNCFTEEGATQNIPEAITLGKVVFWKLEAPEPPAKLSQFQTQINNHHDNHPTAKTVFRENIFL